MSMNEVIKKAEDAMVVSLGECCRYLMLNNKKRFWEEMHLIIGTEKPPCKSSDKPVTSKTGRYSKQRGWSPVPFGDPKDICKYIGIDMNAYKENPMGDKVLFRKYFPRQDKSYWIRKIDSKGRGSNYLTCIYTIPGEKSKSIHYYNLLYTVLHGEFPISMNLHGRQSEGACVSFVNGELVDNSEVDNDSNDMDQFTMWLST